MIYVKKGNFDVIRSQSGYRADKIYLLCIYINLFFGDASHSE